MSFNFDHHLVGFSKQGQFHFDKCLQMGTSSSIMIFGKYNVALQWIMQSKYGVRGMLHILDGLFYQYCKFYEF